MEKKFKAEVFFDDIKSSFTWLKLLFIIVPNFYHITLKCYILIKTNANGNTILRKLTLKNLGCCQLGAFLFKKITTIETK